LNKSDLASAETGSGFAGAGQRGRLRVSAKTGEGIGGLRSSVALALAPGEGAIQLAGAADPRAAPTGGRTGPVALSRASVAAGEGLPLEFPAADVREAAGASRNCWGGCPGRGPRRDLQCVLHW